MQDMYLVKKGCPLCKGDLRGNDEFKFFCKRCNILFDKKDIRKPKSQELAEKPLVDKEAEKLRKMLEKARREEEKIEKELQRAKKEVSEGEIEEEKTEVEKIVEAALEEEPCEEKEAGDEKEKEEEVEEAGESEEDAEVREMEEKGKIIVSEKSDKMHIPTCHFLRKIKRENWAVLDSIEEAEKQGYEKCVCVRRKLAKERG